MQYAEALLTCRELLDGHAEYLDGLLPVREARRFDTHIQHCPSCQRYDRVMRRGLLLARNLPEIQPSDHFHERLQARLMNLDAAPSRQPIVASSATALVIAAVLAVIALTPLLPMLDSGLAPGGSSPAFTAMPTSFVPLGATALVPTPPASPSAVLVRMEQPSYFSPTMISLPAVQMAPSASRLITNPSVQAATNR